MSVKLHHQSFASPSSSNSWFSRNTTRIRALKERAVGLDNIFFIQDYSRKRCFARVSLLEYGNIAISSGWMDFRRNHSIFLKSRRKLLLPLASTDDGVTVNSRPQKHARNDVEEMRLKLDQSDHSTGLVQSLHDAARVFELAIKEQSQLSKLSWLSTAWLGVDRNAWVKALSYQAAVYSLLHAVIEISSCGDERDRDVNVFVQRSLLRQSAPLESVIREKLSVKQPEAYEWFWSEQVPAVVTSFVDFFEKEKSFAGATVLGGKEHFLGLGNASDITLLMLSLRCIAAITKLGSTKVSCTPFFSMIPDTTGRLLDMLAEFVPICQVYHSMKDIGLHREFLKHFGSRAAACRFKNDRNTEEVVFWLGLLQKQLQRAVDRERIWCRLTTSESIEVLERDLAIFGFFIALGRSTQNYLSANGFDVVEEPIQGFIRYLIGGGVLYYPLLASISSYQLYVEVVCEELDWLPFYPGNYSNSKHSRGHRSKEEFHPNTEAIPVVLDVCSYWIQSFIKYSKWLENPSNIKAAKFLSQGHKKLMACMRELGIQKSETTECTTELSAESIGSGTSPTGKDSDSFDKALDCVEEALVRLEELLQELHMSSSSSEKEHLKAACSDLERIRKLKKEAEFLEASFRAKAASFQQGDDDDDSDSPSSKSKQQQNYRGKSRKKVNANMDRSSSTVGNPQGLWSLFVRNLSRKSDTGLYGSDGDPLEHAAVSIGMSDSESNEIQRFEVLRNELLELERRVQKSDHQYESDEEEINMENDTASYSDKAAGGGLVQAKKENIIEKSLDKLKGTSMDVWQGTQLLAIDAAAALGLLRRALIGDELTEKEKQSLRRTLTDLASVVPIGFLMLLPVTAVGHAAMLAAIQRYVPSLIPSTYGPERLDLLRQLEKVKELETTEGNEDENAKNMTQSVTDEF